MIKTKPQTVIPSHCLAPELAALEWTEEGELAAAPRCQMVQRLLEAEPQSANHIELIRVSQSSCISGDGESPPPKQLQPSHLQRGGQGFSPGRHPPDHRGDDAPPSK